ncbi:MAG: hypothetical protein XD66_1249 [Thermacetogenium phaeum]|jgi:hypothetical protein|uniref:Uncharacterized protein n=1 Tax=Thermacetogenium phaeum TaxID=85874 RepID=A0A101FFF1_9THEO|nr:MAG: hypothetical protein XD66_1249 [Thermacetogenium phaeum]
MSPLLYAGWAVQTLPPSNSTIFRFSRGYLNTTTVITIINKVADLSIK